MVDTVHRKKFPGPSIKLLQVHGPPMNDSKTVSENQQCKPVNAQNLVATAQLNMFTLQKYLRRNVSCILLCWTVTLIHTQILVDLTRFQTVDGVLFSYHHPRILSKSLPLTKCEPTIDKVCNSTLVAHLSRPNFIRVSSEKVRTVCKQPFQLIRISAIQLHIIHVKQIILLFIIYYYYECTYCTDSVKPYF